jgi:hypothetical protein
MPYVFHKCKIRFFLKVIRNPASKSLQSIEISLYLVFTNEWNVAKKEKIINEWFILLKEILFCSLYNIPDVDETFSIGALWRQWECMTKKSDHLFKKLWEMTS